MKKLSSIVYSLSLVLASACGPSTGHESDGGSDGTEGGSGSTGATSSTAGGSTDGTGSGGPGSTMGSGGPGTTMGSGGPGSTMGPGTDTSGSSGSDCPTPATDINSCSGERVCSALDWGGSVSSKDGECFWVLLRDRTPGQTFALTGCCDDNSTTTVRIENDGTVATQRSRPDNHGDCPPAIGPARAGVLADVSFFEQCIAAPTSPCYDPGNWWTEGGGASACPG